MSTDRAGPGGLRPGPPRRARLVALGAIAALVAVAGWIGGAGAPDGATGPGQAAPLPAAPRWSVLAAGDPSGPEAEAAGAAVAAVERRLYGTGSLRGTEPDGAWSVDAQGRLQPSIVLRRRFDHYLAALGEASVDELTALMQAHAERDVGAEAAAQIRAVWDRYLAVQRHPYRTQVRLQDPHSWHAALAERQAVRRAQLGPVWAQAFYRDEEQALEAHVASSRSAGADAPAAPAAEAAERALLAPPGAGTDAAALHEERVRRFGAQAAERLREEDRAWADWQRRLAEAREHIAALQRAPELSQAQRQAAMTRVIDEAFAPDERLRARGLLLP